MGIVHRLTRRLGLDKIRLRIVSRLRSVDGPISNQIGVAAKIAILTETWQTSKSKTNTKRSWRRETLSTEVSICTKEALVVFMAPQQLATIARTIITRSTYR